HMETKKAEDVGKGLAAQKDRLAELEKMAEGLEEKADGGTDARVKEIESLLEEGDRDAVDLADQMVRWMSRELDQAEDDNRGKALEAKFDEEYQTALELTADPEKGAERRQTEALALEFRAAIRGKDYETARQKTDDLVALVYRLLRRLPAYWAAVFAHLCARLTQLGPGNAAQGVTNR